MPAAHDSQETCPLRIQCIWRPFRPKTAAHTAVPRTPHKAPPGWRHVPRTTPPAVPEFIILTWPGCEGDQAGLPPSGCGLALHYARPAWLCAFGCPTAESLNCWELRLRTLAPPLNPPNHH